LHSGQTILIGEDLRLLGWIWSGVAPVETTLPTKMGVGVVAVNGTADDFWRRPRTG
jgi:hypothetical protein